MTQVKPDQPIVLYGFGPAFGLPDASPFVLKTETQLRMAELPYEKDLTGRSAAPKGKLPYIRDGRALVADSTFIRLHLEWSYGFDLDAGLSGTERALAWSLERMIEDHLYWIAMKYRWLDAANFAKGPSHFFDGAPAAIRDDLRAEALDRIRQTLHGHGIGRHDDEDILHLGMRSLQSLSQVLGEKPFLFGAIPSGTDATAFAVMAHIMAPIFESPLRDEALACGNLYPYVRRLLQHFYPDFELAHWPAQPAALSCAA